MSHWASANDQSCLLGPLRNRVLPGLPMPLPLPCSLQGRPFSRHPWLRTVILKDNSDTIQALGVCSAPPQVWPLVAARISWAPSCSWWAGGWEMS